MTEYEVTLANHQPAVVLIDADEVRYDPHWVAFLVREKPDAPSPVHCEACGEPTGVRRVNPAARTVTVAIFPASQVRRVVRTVENG